MRLLWVIAAIVIILFGFSVLYQGQALINGQHDISGKDDVFEHYPPDNDEIVFVSAGEPDFIDWANLSNPIMIREDCMLKDQSVVYHNGWFYIFTSHRFEADYTGDRSTYIYKTEDFKEYEYIPLVYGDSPDISKIGDTYYMVFQVDDPNSKNERHKRLHYMSSVDAENWTDHGEIYPGLSRGRNIDGALAKEGDYYYLGYKKNQKFYITRSTNNKLDGSWLKPIQARPGERQSLLDYIPLYYTFIGGWAENYQFIKIDGRWHLVATGYVGTPLEKIKHFIFGYTSGHETFIYDMEEGKGGDNFEDWKLWLNKTPVVVPDEGWNSVMRSNSGYLCDWREHDGYFYLFYAGAADSKSFTGRGHGKIGIIRSKDLRNWELPGSGQCVAVSQGRFS